MASYLDEQTAGGEVLIIKAVAEQYRPGEPGVHPLHAPLPCGGETEVLPPAGQPDAAAVVTPADDHDLRGLLPRPAPGPDRGHPGTALRLNGVPVDIQHDFDAGVLFQILLHHGPAVGVAASIAGVVVQGLVMQGVEACRIEGIGHHPAHRTHIDAAIGAAGPVTRAVPQPGGKSVILRGVGVHNQDLRVRAVPLYRKGQRVCDFRRHFCRRDTGVVFDTASAAGDIFFAAAVRVSLFLHGTCIRGAGVVGFQGCKIAFHAGIGRGGGFGGRLRGGL